MAKRTPTAVSTRTASATAVAEPPLGGKPTREQIAARAVEIYQRRCRSREPGDAVGDWLKAEAELKAAALRA